MAAPLPESRRPLPGPGVLESPPLSGDPLPPSPPVFFRVFLRPVLQLPLPPLLSHPFPSPRIGGGDLGQPCDAQCSSASNSTPLANAHFRWAGILIQSTSR